MRDWLQCKTWPSTRHAPDAEAWFVDALCTARAFKQEIVLVYANAAAPLRTRQGAGTLLGHSQVVPFKCALQRCDHNREVMLVQSVDIGTLADAETAYAIRQDLKKGLSLDA